MANPKQVETSLLTEHLRYTPIALIDDIINVVNELINRAVDSIESALLSADHAALGFAARAAAENTIPDADGDGNPIFPEARKEIEDGVHKLETLLESTVDKNFDKLEIYVLRNILSVPAELVPWVRLEGYEDLTIPSKDVETPTPESLQALRRKLQETQKLYAALVAEKSRNEAIIKQLHSLLSGLPPSNTGQTSTVAPKPEDNASAFPGASAVPASGPVFSFLSNTPSAQALGVVTTPASSSASASQPGTGPLVTNTSFTISQLPALRSLLAMLRPRLSSISLQPLGESEAATIAQERREYIEAQTKRALQKQGRDLEGLGGLEGGRRLTGQEVAALEEVVAALGQGEPKQGN